jgi:hypothetical protein
MLGDQDIVQICEIITEQLTALVHCNTNQKSQNIDSKMTDVAICTVIKKVFLEVNWLILIQYSYQTAKSRALYKSTDGPAEVHANYPSNSAWLGDVHRSLPELTISVYWTRGPELWRRYSSDPDHDLEPKRHSGTVANTSDTHLHPAMDDHQLTPSVAYTEHYIIHPKSSVIFLLSAIKLDPLLQLQPPVSLPTRWTAKSQLSMRDYKVGHLVAFPQL